MPLATRPNAKFEVVLSTDLHLPKEEQPVFIFRYTNCIEWEEIAALSDKFDASLETTEMLDLAFQVIDKTLCDWRKMKRPSGQTITFNLKKLKSMVTPAEATELMKAGVSQQPSVEDKKKLESPSISSTEQSAKNAKEPPSAETSQA